MQVVNLPKLSGALLFALSPIGHAVTLTLEVSKDNVIYEDSDGGLSNGGGAYIFVGESGENRELRTLINFDTNSIPAGSIINSAAFILTSNTRRRETVVVATSLHRLLGDWGEGTAVGSGGGGSGAPAHPGDATWIHQSSPGTMWTNPGGDFASSPSATLDVTDNKLYQWSSAQLTADVQGMIDGTFDNFGWLLMGEQGLGSKRFRSSESAAVSERPQLVIDYTPVPEPTSSLLCLLAGLAALARRRR